VHFYIEQNIKHSNITNQQLLKQYEKLLDTNITNLALSDGLPAKQLAFILLMATSEPFHFP
jgi:hypothetical protein